MNKKVIILGLLLLAAVILAGGVFWYTKITLHPVNQSVTSAGEKYSNIIYGDITIDKNDDHVAPLNLVVYSINVNTREKKELFILPANTVGINDYLPNIKFCPVTNKIYIRTSKSIKETPYQNLFIREVDLSGNYKDLDFTGTQLSNYKNWEHYDTGFALSPDCQKIIWSTVYHQYVNHQEVEAANEVVVSDINGGQRNILQEIEHSHTNESAKEIKGWSSSNQDIIYLTNYNWGYNGRAGGLFRLDLKTNLISQINAIPTQNIIWDVSNDDNLVANQQNFLAGSGYESFITNLVDGSIMPLNNDSNGKRKFSPDNSKLANVISSCSGTAAEARCVPNLYLSGLNQPNKLIASGVDLKDWLSNETIIGVRDDKSLITINIHNRKEEALDLVSNYLIVFGLLK